MAANYSDEPCADCTNLSKYMTTSTISATVIKLDTLMLSIISIPQIQMTGVRFDLASLMLYADSLMMSIGIGLKYKGASISGL